MNIYNSLDLIGNTPLVELKQLENKYNLKGHLFAKIEKFNLGGSIKDRIALQMINELEDNHKINHETIIIEPTSGNTGIGLALIGKLKGYKVIIVMPESMSEERKKIIKSYGAELILTPGSEGMPGAIKKAEELHKEYKNSVIAGQFTYMANRRAHYNTTGPEIYNDLDGNVDIFVAGIGTGGTISGTGEYLKEKRPNCKIIGVEPASSPVINKGVAGKHKIQGIGAGFIPEVLNLKVVDEVLMITDTEAIDYARICCQEEGIQVGISSGAALCAAIKILSRKESVDKNLVVIFPDGGEKYLSTELFNL